MKLLFYLLIFFMNLFSLSGQTNKSGNSLKRIDYNLSAPDRVFVLPRTLREISGITEVDASSIACVQDERGIIYIYDINKNQTIRQLYFGSDGDYEDITRVEKTIYVLKSDEMLTEITNFQSADFKTETYPASNPGKDYEGLCYDRKDNRLLLLPKEISEKDKENKDCRFIYGFDLSSKKLIKGPVFRIDLAAIKRFALGNNIKVPMKNKKKGDKEEPDIKFRISALGIHPLTNKLFAISGMERLIFVFDMNGNIEYLERLNPDLFEQPEGITFMKNGDMLISNEGRKESATLVRFNYRPATVPKSAIDQFKPR
jgi:hypothetical protein